MLITSICSQGRVTLVVAENRTKLFLFCCWPERKTLCKVWAAMGQRYWQERVDQRGAVEFIYDNSYMIMLGIVVDGTLLPHLYALVSEPTGHFPANMIMNLPNIHAFASKSANMTKRDLKVFLEQAMWPLSYSTSFGWFLDSQQRWKTIQLYSPWRWCFLFPSIQKFVKFIKDTIMVSSDNDINIWHRGHFLRLQSFVYFQFSAGKVLQLNQLCIFVATTLKTFLVYFKHPWSTASNV